MGYYGEGLSQTELSTTTQPEQGKEELGDDFEGVNLHDPRKPRKYYESPRWGDSPTLKRDAIGSDWEVKTAQ